jgi:4'-phosphopantetheinyl transferase
VRCHADSSRRVAIRYLATRSFADPRVYGGALELLAPAERATLARLRAAEARHDYLAAHALTRTTLCEFAGGDARRLEFHVSSLGRPSVAAPPELCDLRFSTSHADGIAICAVGERVHVGADVETLRNVGSDALALAELIASRRERQTVFEAPPTARPARLLAIWTLKEALGKATGLGLRFPVRNVTVVDERGQPLATPLFDVAPSGDAPHWQLACRYVTQNHLAAVAVRCALGEPIELEFEEGRVPVRSDGG